MAELTRKDIILLIAAIPTAGCQKPNHLVRLAGVDLSGLDLNGLNLAHVDLAGANLRGCNLSDANLTDSDLSCADLTDAILCGIYAEGASFVDAKLIRADFRPSQRDTFCGTQLIETDFQGADLTNARFSGAHLSGARFCEANLTGVELSNAHIDKSTSFDRAQISGSTQELIKCADDASAASSNLRSSGSISQVKLQSNLKEESSRQKSKAATPLAA